MRKITPLVLVAVAALATIISAQANLVINGSFESGNTGFGSDYTYNTDVPLEAGLYNIVANSQDAHPAWVDLGPQSGSLFYVANGSPDINLSPWFQTITPTAGQIITGEAYRFQAYISSLYFENPPQLAFEISLNGSGTWTTLSTSVAPEQTGVWYRSYGDTTFLSEPTSISLRLRNAVDAENGNDFGIDSIYFGLASEAPVDAVPEPGTWAAAAMLLGGAGFARWRKRAKRA